MLLNYVPVVVSVLRNRGMERVVNRIRLQAVCSTFVHNAGGREIGRGNGLIERGGIPPGELPGYLGAAVS
ncbi:MAG: hypothetical protein OXN16_13180 [Gammaproteobacteria bacterium]|nr:hypothetical protein [Gammaproteobacteria bacterium]